MHLSNGKQCAETCRSLILVMNHIWLSACVCSCINFKNTLGMSSIKFVSHIKGQTHIVGVWEQGAENI